MTDYEQARLASYRKTLTALDRYPGEVAAVGALQRSVDWVRGQLAELEKAAERQAAYVAQGEAKEADLQALADAAVPVAQALAAKADEEGDEAAAALYDVETTDVTQGTDQDALAIGGTVLKGAQAVDPAALAEYGAEPADVAALATALAAFREAVTAPQDAIAVRSADTVEVKRLVKAVGAHLRKRTDRLMTRYRKTPFGAEYRTARTIIDP